MKINAPRRTLRSGERGIALVLTMFLVMAMSALAASLMVLAVTETAGTMNYRLMSQARYGAESGVQKAVNYLLNDYLLVQPGTAGDPLTNYNTTVSPVTSTINGLPVVLSSDPATANYPVAAVKTAFMNLAHDSLAAGTASVTYAASAKLVSMRPVSGGVVQTWQITSVGTMAGVRAATEEVTATLETLSVPQHGYAVFATASTCGAIDLAGGAGANSYNSSSYASGTPTTVNSSADVGTNGNLHANGNGIVYGALYTPRTGVGVCSSGAPDAASLSGNAAVNGGLIAMPSQLVPVTPVIAIPSPVPPTSTLTISGSTTCASFMSAAGLAAPLTCSGTAGNLTIQPHGTTVTLGSVSVSSATLTFGAGRYSMNSLDLSSSNMNVIAGFDAAGSVIPGVQMTLVGTGASTIVNMSGNTAVTIPLDRSASLVMNLGTPAGNAVPVNVGGGSEISNLSYDATLLQINYGGTGPMTLSGGSHAAGLINAPNSDLTMAGGVDWYGSLLVKTLRDTGGTMLHYDTNLANFFAVAGRPLLSSFSWKRF